jgi:hypothetical protein
VAATASFAAVPARVTVEPVMVAGSISSEKVAGAFAPSLTFLVCSRDVYDPVSWL